MDKKDPFDTASKLLDEMKEKLSPNLTIETNKIDIEFLRQDGLKTCPDCRVLPGEPHKEGCDVEICSVCGMQHLTCGCKGHDKAFARWNGIWPGVGEALALKTDINGLYRVGYHKVLFIKPKTNRYVRHRVFWKKI